MASDGRRARVRRGWSDLPDDILDTVYRLCCSSSSPYDRARFAGVCSSWRRALASLHPKVPALPLLLHLTSDAKRDPKARAYSLDDGRALRVPPRGYPQGRIVGSHDGGWLAAVTGPRLLIVNVFSGARVRLSLKQSIVGCKLYPRVANRIAGGQPQNRVVKIIFSEDPSSNDCVMIATRTGSTRCNITLCKVGCPDGGWTTGQCGTDQRIRDIAFCNGNLYGLAYTHLYKFDLCVNENGAPEVTSVHLIDIERGILSVCWWQSREKYVFKLHGKLVIAIKLSSWSYTCETPFFRLFELKDDGCTWVELTSLGDHALFLGQTCCKAVHMPVIGGCSRMERNHIYYFEEQLCSHDETKCLKRLYVGSYSVCYVKNEGVDPSQRIMSTRYRYGHEDGSDGCIWIHSLLL